MPEKNFVIALVTEAAKLAQTRWSTLQVSTKNGDSRDLLTTIDIEVSNFIKEAIKSNFPADGFYSEEATIDAVDGGRVWLIDPIDGTSNYIRNLPLYSTCITLIENGAFKLFALAAPALDQTFYVDEFETLENGVAIATNDTVTPREAYVVFHPGRKPEGYAWAGQVLPFLLEHAKKNCNYGSSALELCYLASGRLDTVIYGTLTPIDIYGAVEAVRRAGGEVYNARTMQPLTMTREPERIVAVANTKLWDAWQAINLPL
jgi:myo-inositol-1(or 4)-monophosphatase